MVCGDRHWQYHSISEKGLNEFSCGSISDKHAEGIREHPLSGPRWLRNKQPYYRNLIGGFLSVNVSRVNNNPVIVFRNHNVFGTVLYKWEKSAWDD